MMKSRVKDRITSYEVIEIGYISKHSLKFHKKSIYGSSKADAYFTDVDNDIVWGVLGKIDRTAKAALDRFEGLGKGYDEKTVQVTTKGAKVEALMYYANENYIVPDLLPYDWYKEFVLRGSIENSLPVEYIEAIRNQQFVVDSNEDRRKKNFSILEESNI